MPEPDLFHIFLGPLNRLDIPYLVTGAVASIVYGEVRVTHDIDLIVDLKRDDVENIAGAYPAKEFYCPPLETLRTEVGRSNRGHFNLIHHETGFKADIYISGKDELHHWAFLKKREIEISGETIWLAPPEYVLLRKLEYYREGGSDKHIRDIAGIMEVSGHQIAFNELEEKIMRLGLEKEWEKAKDFVSK